MEDESLQQQSFFRHNHSEETVKFSIRGMESVVATVSGYHGSDRFKIIKLISQTGASFVGSMNRSTTHLVCWKLEGRKYDLAKKLNTLIVNHRWVEECIKQRRRVPEHPYILQSGQEVGPLSLEVSPVAGKMGVLLSTQSNSLIDSKEPAINIRCEGTNDVVLTDCFLLDENLFSELGTSKNRSHKSKKKTMKNKLRQDRYSGNRYCFQEPPVSSSDRMEYEDSSSPSSVEVVRQKRRSTTSTEPSRKCRRLMKKSFSSDMSQFLCVDSEEESYPVRDHHQPNDMTAPSFHFDCGRNENILRIRTSDGGFYDDDGGNRNENLEDFEEIGHTNDLAFEDSNLRSKATPSSLGAPLNQCFDVDENIKEAEHSTRLPSSTELSCVICWTDFSSTRGVLPCGHRFCFSCIQSWADHMASMRKILTCPLCKAKFGSITKVDDVGSSDQKIYSQTIPYDPSTTNIVILPDGEMPTFGAQIRCVHSYCLDPPLFPWTCIHCKDLQMLYHDFR
ncbi:uncharacterized protein LOC132287188 isoform X2 [Cornus florida]|uniref:uncharacterized protein LOC132287188 isoform X2 n=1 Tax=Cornus florida TaxID=4283 RepID=UPI0028974A72|nr:uncharacterized protein LOC132287188 isoform X2 [Cornus florida]